MDKSGILKENLLAEALERGVLYLKEHRQVVMAVGTTLLAGGALTAYILIQKQQVYERNWQMLSMAQSQVMQGQLNQGIATLQDLLSKYRSGPVLEQAYQLMGGFYMAAGKPHEAAKSYGEGLRHISHENNKSLLLMCLAAAYEDAQEPSKAVDTYSQFLKIFPEHYLAPRALLGLVRVQSLTNNLPAARESYEKLLTLYSDTSWTKRAGAYLQAKPNPSPSAR